jgi:hypothetical protein
MSYRLFSGVSVNKRNVNPVIAEIPKTSTLIRLTKLQAVDPTGIFIRNIDQNSVGKIRAVQNGLAGIWIGIPYGDTEILFEVQNPLEPFTLEFIPGYYLWDYNLEVFVSFPNPRFDALRDKWGLNEEQISTLPNQILEILMVLDSSKSADTRNMIASIERTAEIANRADQTSTTVAADLIAAKDEMVQNREFSLVAASFSRIGSYYVAEVAHDLTGSKPQLSLIDNEGDEQGFSQLIANGIDKAKVELTVNQFENGSFPLTLTIQGKESPAGMVAGAWKLKPLSDRYYRLLNGNVDRSMNASDVENAALLTQIVEAFMAGASQLVYWKNLSGQTGYIDNGSLGNGPTAVSMADYDLFKGLPDSVLL